MGIEVIIGAIVGMVALIIGGATANQNYSAQQQNLQYQKEMQQKVFEREDNAVLRRAKDLEAAGLSKTLAAGSAAQTSNPIVTQAPQFDGSFFSSALGSSANIMSMAKQNQDITQTKAQTALTQEMTQNKALERNLINAQVNQANAQAYKSYTDAGVSKWDLEQAMKNNIGTKPTPLGGLYRDTKGIIGDAKEGFLDYMKFQQTRSADYYKKAEKFVIDDLNNSPVPFMRPNYYKKP